MKQILQTISAWLLLLCAMHCAPRAYAAPWQARADSSGVEVKGTVTDSLGTFLPGATITVKGQPRTGTASDPNGRFILNVPGPNTVLVFQMMGYIPLEVPLAGRKEIKVTLKVSPSE